MSTPCVSIIVPVYNVQDYISRALDSALRQTLTDLEIIVIDDGSDDASGAICDVYAQRYPKRIQVCHQTHAGVSAARNRAMEMARGTYLAFLDSDDYLSNDFCEVLYGAAVSAKADICKGGMVVKDPDGNLDKHAWEGARYNQLLRTWRSPLFFFYGWWCALYRRAMVEQYSLRFRPELIIGQDMVFLNEALLCCQSLALRDEGTYIHCHRTESAIAGSGPLPPEKLQACRAAHNLIADHLCAARQRLDVPGVLYVFEQLLMHLRNTIGPRIPGGWDNPYYRSWAAELWQKCPYPNLLHTRIRQLLHRAELHSQAAGHD